MKRSTERGIKTLVWLGFVGAGAWFGVKYVLPTVTAALDRSNVMGSAGDEGLAQWEASKPSNITGDPQSDHFLIRMLADLKDIPHGLFTYYTYMQGEATRGGSGGNPADVNTGQAAFTF